MYFYRISARSGFSVPSRVLSCISAFVCWFLSNLSYCQDIRPKQNIDEITEKIEHDKKNATLYLQRSKLLLERCKQEREAASSSWWDFPSSRAGIESNKLALGDATTAINLDPKMAKAYFQRANVRMWHPDFQDFWKWRYFSKSSASPGVYEEYGMTEKPKLVRQLLEEEFLSDVNTVLKLQPTSENARGLRWMVLCLLEKSDEALNEINAALKDAEIGDTWKIELLQKRINIFNLEGNGEASQIQADAKEIQRLKTKIFEQKKKSNAEKLIPRLSEQLQNNELTESERAKLLEYRAQTYRTLELIEFAAKDEKHAKVIRVREARENIDRLTNKLSSDEISKAEKIQFLKGRASHYRFVGDLENHRKDVEEAARLEVARAKARFGPLIEKLTLQIEENKTNARREHSFLRRRARYYQRINETEQAKADLELAQKIHEEGYKYNSKLIGGDK